MGNQGCTPAGAWQPWLVRGPGGRSPISRRHHRPASKMLQRHSQPPLHPTFDEARCRGLAQQAGHLCARWPPLRQTSHGTRSPSEGGSSFMPRPKNHFPSRMVRSFLHSKTACHGCSSPGCRWPFRPPWSLQPGRGHQWSPSVLFDVAALVQLTKTISH